MAGSRWTICHRSTEKSGDRYIPLQWPGILLDWPVDYAGAKTWPSKAEATAFRDQHWPSFDKIFQVVKVGSVRAKLRTTHPPGWEPGGALRMAHRRGKK